MINLIGYVDLPELPVISVITPYCLVMTMWVFEIVLSMTIVNDHKWSNDELYGAI